ncbi:MAG: hypothetical protein AAFR64_08565 [Pseudomonadota bacterium]
MKALAPTLAPTLTQTLAGLALMPMVAALSVSACAQESDPPAIEVEAAFENYLDAPQTPGTWEYEDEPAESLGLFGIPNPMHPFVVRCDKQLKIVSLARASTAQGPLTMIIQTETTTRQLVAGKVEGYDFIAANLDPNDPLLDAMAITKGRFVVGLEGEETLYVPAWTEFSRVVEDCR